MHDVMLFRVLINCFLSYFVTCKARFYKYCNNAFVVSGYFYF
jgi:hypothetical protein